MRFAKLNKPPPPSLLSSPSKVLEKISPPGSLIEDLRCYITAVARWLFRREYTFDFAGERGGGGGGWRRCFKHFLEYTYFFFEIDKGHF